MVTCRALVLPPQRSIRWTRVGRRGQELHCLNENCDYKIELLDEENNKSGGNGNENNSNGAE
jgi:hypothetical protein